MLDTSSGNLYVAPSVALMIPLTGQAHLPAEEIEVIMKSIQWVEVHKAHKSRANRNGKAGLYVD